MHKENMHTVEYDLVTKIMKSCHLKQYKWNRDYYDKGNKPHTEKQVPHDLFL